MSRNGTGTYTLPAGNPVVTGTTISSTWANNTLADIQNALTGSIAADGQTPITGALSGTNGTVSFAGVGQTRIPSGTTAQRAATPLDGMIRYNTDLQQYEGYKNGAWSIFGNGAGGTLFSDTVTATQGQTVINMPTGYVQGGDNLSVYVNGSRQIYNVNYTETSTTSFTFSTGLNVGDLVNYTIGASTSLSVNAASVLYNEGGTGAVDRNVEQKLQESVSVKDFGAVGNGVADDTAAIQAALNSFGTAGGALYFPAGNYKVSAPLINQQIYTDEGEFLLQGAGGATTITSTHNGPVIKFEGTTTKIQDMKFVGPGVSLTSSTAFLGTLSKGTLINCNISNYYIGININNTICGVIERCYIFSCHFGVSAITTNGQFENLINLKDTWFIGNDIGFTGYKLINSIFQNVIFDNNITNGFLLNQCYSFNLISVWTENPTTDTAIFTDSAIDLFNCRVSSTNVYTATFPSVGIGQTRTLVSQGVLFANDINLTTYNNTSGGVNSGTFVTSNIIRPFYQPANGNPTIITQVINSTYPNNYQLWNGNPNDGSTEGSVGPQGQSGQLILRTNSTSDLIGLELFNNAYPNSGKPTIAFSNWNGGSFYNPKLQASGNNLLANGNSFSPSADNTSSSGTAALRWSVVYSATGAINTSDANQKINIVDISDVEKRVAVKLKSSMKRFKFKDGNRYHFGVIAQNVKAAFESEGLVAEEYGVFCSDTLEDGSIRLGVRYDELLAFIISAL